MTSSAPSHPAGPSGRAPQHPRHLSLRRALLRWFRRHARPLPWRQTRDPYAIWVSEVMLQQTQVATVIPYYDRFLRAFPSLEHLARGRLERVLELWSGLGYYRRARNLHAAARKIVAGFGGKFPRTLPEARSLPGVGAYTAAAVLSMAFDAPLAALDGNVARVVARLEALPGSVADARFRRRTEAVLSALISLRHPGDFNQALMELGQSICLPRAPRCPACPLRRHCRACASGRPEAFPSPRPRRAGERHHLAAAAVFRRHQGVTAEPSVLLVRGLDDGLMPDLWNFPSALSASPATARARLTERLEAMCAGPAGRIGEELARLKHGVTYRNILVRVYRAEAEAPSGPDHRWIGLDQVNGAAVSQLARKIARALASPGCGN